MTNGNAGSLPAGYVPLRVVAQRGDDQFLVGNGPTAQFGYLVTAAEVIHTRVVSQLARGYWDTPRLTDAAERAVLTMVARAAQSIT